MVLEKTLENPLDCNEIKPVNCNGNQFWIFTGGNDAEAETPILWPPLWRTDSLEKKPWCWERLKAGGVENDRGWYGLMASQTQWTWVWTNSRSYWWTGNLGVLESMGSQSDTTEWLIWTASSIYPILLWDREGKQVTVYSYSLSLFFLSLSLTPSLGLFTSFFFSLSHKIGLKESVCVFMSISLLFLCP